MREHIYHCSAAGCDAHQRSTARPPLPGWLVVVEHGADGPQEVDVCGWDCLLALAGRTTPDEVIGWEP